METYFMAAMIVFIGGLYVWEKRETRKERADLITRIMAKSLPEYAKNVIKVSSDNAGMTIEEAIRSVEEDRANDRVSVI